MKESLSYSQNSSVLFWKEMKPTTVFEIATPYDLKQFRRPFQPLQVVFCATILEMLYKQKAYDF